MPHPQVAERASLRYRPDIDGLRAIAVVPVVLFHFGVPGFTGGYVGVDVFFVISGYLITALIFAEMQTGEFSVLRFYERRVRRIFPALFAMIAATVAAAAVLFFPRDLMRLAESVAATTVFGSNIDFWLQSGYFDVSADVKPLLHTWSLAVEEQFYLVFPALLYAIHTRRRAILLALVVALAVLSFALSVWGVRTYPDAAFYLAPYRTWELMLGAMLALGGTGIPAPRFVREILAALGLAMIACAIALYTAKTPFPGEAALLPCVGTAFVLLAGEGEGAALSRLLSLGPVVFVGLISYSLYLWHWPIYVFARYVAPDGLGAVEAAALIALSAVLAVLSWHFVERPFRAGCEFFPRRRLFRLAGLAMTASLAVAGVFFGFNGFPQRFSPSVQTILAESFDEEPRRHGCFNRTAEEVERGDYCEIGDMSARAPTFLLWGDSHADALLPAVAAAAIRAHRKGYFIARGNCAPLLDARRSDDPTDRCVRLNKATFERARAAGIQIVILAARWARYDRGTGYGPDANVTCRLIDLARDAPETDGEHAVFERVLARTIGALVRSGKKIIVVGPVPEVSVDVPETLAHIAIAGSAEDIRPTVAAYRERQAGVLSTLERLRRDFGFTYVDPAQALCHAGRCAVEADGKPLYVDHQHLSVFGATTISDIFAPVF